jgi:hypothetical protein
MALTASKNIKSRNRSIYGVALRAGYKVYQGAIVCINTADGYGEQGRTATTLKAVGVAQETVDNSSTGKNTNGTKVPVKSGEIFGPYDNSTASDAITIANREALCYIVDDGTVALTNGSNTRSIAGVIKDVDSAGGVYVLIPTDRTS